MDETTLKADIATATPTGTIMMWSGSVDKLPVGWSLCDGTMGTPDLRGKFVRTCQRTADSDCDVGANGGGSGVTNLAGAHSHGGQTGGHSLTVGQIPSHSHGGDFMVHREGSFIGDHGDHGWYEDVDATTGSTGGGEEHLHGIVSDGGHTHIVDATPPFYSLAFIMFHGLPAAMVKGDAQSGFLVV